MFIIGGSCSSETKKQVFSTVDFLYKRNITNFRIAVNKYRSDPETYQGTEEAVGWIKEIKSLYKNVRIYTEVFNEKDIELLVGLVDVFQVGSRNQTNTSLLKEINKTKKQVLFKRHYAASLEEFVKHSEYLKDCEIIMCLRGIMSLHPQEQRFFPDLTDIARLREMTSNPICFDASHSACFKRFVPKLIEAAKVFEPEYIMIEVHPNPKEAKSDAQQQLSFEEFKILKDEGLFN